MLDRKRESFTGYHPLPLRHGMTIGELARLFNRERKINADLEVIPMEGLGSEPISLTERIFSGSIRRRTCGP